MPDFTFNGHSHIRIKGDAQTPSRFWDITLLTETEYEALSDINKKEYSRIKPSQVGYLIKHFK